MILMTIFVHPNQLNKADAVDSQKLHTILFRFKALLWESTILLLPPPTCEAYPVAILLHDHCAIYALPPTLLLYAIHNTILVMAISCKGQFASVNEQALVSL